MLPEDVQPSSGGEERQTPQFFKAEVADFGNGLCERTSIAHVPLIIPIFAPRGLPTEQQPKPRPKKRKFTAVEEEKRDDEITDMKTHRQYSALTAEYENQNIKLFEEFFVIGAAKEIVLDTMVKNRESRNDSRKMTAILQPINIFQYPNLPINSDW